MWHLHPATTEATALQSGHLQWWFVGAEQELEDCTTLSPTPKSKLTSQIEVSTSHGDTLLGAPLFPEISNQDFNSRWGHKAIIRETEMLRGPAAGKETSRP